jgi:hypothetical protein
MTTPTSDPKTRSWQEELAATGDELISRVKELVHQGNVRRIIVKHDGRTVVEFPLTLGVVGTLLAPQLAALGAVAALITDCTVTVEREEPPESRAETKAEGEGDGAVHPLPPGQS